MKKIALTAALIGAATSFASPALANNVVNLGTLSGGSTTLESDVLSVDGTTDKYNFSLSEASSLYTSLSDLKLSGSFGSQTFTLLDSPSVTVALKSGLTTIGSYTVGSGMQSGYQFDGLQANTNYTLVVNGLGTGLAGGAYLLALHPLAAAPVPGPAGLLVAGAGGLLVAAKRRRNAKTAAA